MGGGADRRLQRLHWPDPSPASDNRLTLTNQTFSCKFSIWNGTAPSQQNFLADPPTLLFSGVSPAPNPRQDISPVSSIIGRGSEQIDCIFLQILRPSPLLRFPPPTSFLCQTMRRGIHSLLSVLRLRPLRQWRMKASFSQGCSFFSLLYNPSAGEVNYSITVSAIRSFKLGAA